MKEVLISNCEKAFINDVIASNQRIDGRNLDQFRPITINFGADWGSVHVSLGETRVLAQVSCEVAQPKATRPTEGLLFLKVELGPMAAPHFEANRPSDLGVQVNRILERAFKDSNCVDLESLCIVADEKVWTIKVDLNVLNHEGNIIDCASVAVLAALSHFKRPDVTTSGDEVIIHTLAEKDPIPMVLHHYPVCVSYAIFQNGEISIADPSALEERVAEANLVFGLNSYRELCGLHFGGITMTSSQLLLKCANRGARQAKHIVAMVKEALKRDEDTRTSGTPVSFTECVRLNKITSLAQNRLTMRLKRFRLDKCTKTEDSDAEDSEEDDDDGNEDGVRRVKHETDVLVAMDDKSAALVPLQPKWVPEHDFEGDAEQNEEDEQIELDEDENVAMPVVVVKSKKKKNKKNRIKEEAMDEDSEEEQTVVLSGEQML